MPAPPSSWSGPFPTASRSSAPPWPGATPGWPSTPTRRSWSGTGRTRPWASSCARWRRSRATTSGSSTPTPEPRLPDPGVAAHLGVGEAARLDRDDRGAAADPTRPVGHEAVTPRSDGEAERAVGSRLPGGGDGPVLAEEAQGRLHRLVG